MHKYDNIIIVHKAALGDFFLAWPAVRELRLGLPDVSSLPNLPALWHGRREYLPWLQPLGVRPCAAPLAAAVDALCAGGPWPMALARSLVVWFGLAGPPPVRHAQLWYLQGLQPHGPDRFQSPTDSYMRQLMALEPAFQGYKRHAEPGSRRQGWSEVLPSWDGPKDKRAVLLFPGAGHRLKQWPLVKYFELADLLAGRGLEPLLVLGPAEVERGLDPGSLSTVMPADVLALQGLLLQARLAVGNDCGPMHLAGMLGVPGVGVFGPTSRRQWAPPGITALAAPQGDAPCRPCTMTTRDLRCDDPLCLRAVSVHQVVRAVDELLGSPK